MFQVYFGGLTQDRLGRIGYLGFWLLLAVFTITCLLLIGLGLGFSEDLVGGELQDAQQTLRDEFGVAFIAVLWLAGLLFLFAELNLSAKRVRHIGLPGWPVTLAASAVIVLASLLVSQTLGHGLSLVAWLALIGVPGGIVKNA